MQRDFSIWQRAEDIWQEAHQSAREQRRARQAEQGIERAAPALSWRARLSQWLVANHRRRAVKRVAGTLAILITVGAFGAQADAAAPAQLIRALAEGILGRDTVTFVRLTDQGTTAVLQWASPTYRRENALAVTRELLYAEAALTAGAILGSRFEVVRIRFTIVRGGRVLASGETSRARSLVVAYEAALGGGTYTATDAPVRPAVPGGDRAAQEL